MTNNPSRVSKSRKLRNALLASVLTMGVAGAAASGAILTDTKPVLAEQVQVDIDGPRDFTHLVQRVKPAVVSVRVKSKVDPVEFRGNFSMPDLPDDNPLNEFFKRFGPRGFENDGKRGPHGREHPRFGMSQGSGFFISEDGYIVTNDHVVDNGSEVTVVMEDGKELTAKVVGVDERTDLALLKVDGSGYSYVPLAKEKPMIGQWVVAVGNPFGLGGTVTAGIVSADGRDIGAGPYDDFIQIDAPVNRGNSGGPTFNMKGEVVGVNTAIFSPSGGNIGIAFAIPASVVSGVVDELRQDGSVTRGWLGVQIQPVTQDIADGLGITSTDGALVADPQDGGPAKAAGIKAGDIITKVDGNKVDGPRDLARMIAAYEPDTKVDLTVLRNGDEKQVTVELGKLGKQVASSERGDEDNSAQTSLEGLGLSVQPSDDGRGVVVVGVEAGSAAEEKGLSEGDVILSAGGRDVRTGSDLEDQIASVKDKGRKAVLMQVERDGSPRFVALPTDKS
ncbi:Do family serine endopeptidase [Afifella sp. IM 167]|uniref:Do family serine endopeptidase n=1 Tax=Afifella sp. IM 167 TaxID=2033586 RepID=UPI001CCFC1EE|nr:Do family serine endopeptidase [Afifella sp. IM 167]MBZ8133928.1 serine protease [Afifella sp. IM 167]